MSDPLTVSSGTALGTVPDGRPVPDGGTVVRLLRAPVRRDRWRHDALVRPAVIYLVSRVVTVAAIAAAARMAHLSFAAGIDRWDSRWFLRAAANGWPRHLVTVHGHVTGTTIAFFPVFPLASRWLAHLTGAPLLATAVTLSTITGLSAVAGVWVLVRDYAGSAAADRATLLVAVFPGSFVFSMAYAEGTAITLVAWGLVALRRRRWWLAGWAGAVATATSPVALAFAISCLWVAVVEVRRTRTRRALVAPALVPAGFVGYQLWLWRHSGNLWAWMLTERGGWSSYLSVKYPWHVVSSFVTHPLGGTADTNVIVAGTVVAAIGAVFAWRDRQPAALLLYGLTVALLALFTAPVGLRPRFVLDAFPLVAAFGAHVGGKALGVVVVASTIALVALTFYSVDTRAVFP